jgi:hypothetical protein
MVDTREDLRTEDPHNTHRASFLTGGTDAVNGKQCPRKGLKKTDSEPKGWAQDALGYNMLVVDWPRLK